MLIGGYSAADSHPFRPNNPSLLLCHLSCTYWTYLFLFSLIFTYFDQISKTEVRWCRDKAYGYISSLSETSLCYKRKQFYYWICGWERHHLLPSFTHSDWAFTNMRLPHGNAPGVSTHLAFPLVERLDKVPRYPVSDMHGPWRCHSYFWTSSRSRASPAPETPNSDKNPNANVQTVHRLRATRNRLWTVRWAGFVGLLGQRT